MPPRAKELTAVEVKRLTDDGLHAVGGVAGLCLQVEGKARSWVFRAMMDGRRRSMGIGPYPEISLAMARQKAYLLRAQIVEGLDPIALRQAAKKAKQAERHRGLTFSEAVDLFAPIKTQELAAGKYADQWRDSIDRFATPILGKRLVSDISLQDIKGVLDPIWMTKCVTADKLRRKLREIFDYCITMGHRTADNPAQWDGKLALVMPDASSVAGSEHYAALQHRDLARFWALLALRDGVGAEALRFQALTATRTGAVRFMTWDEVDFEEKVWTIQPGRQSSKIGRRERPKRVPLTPMMIEILMRRRAAGGTLVFGNSLGKPLSDATLAKLMRVIHEADVRQGGAGFVDGKTGEVVVPHGTRSAFKVWATERTDFDWQLSEAALWHTLGGKVEQAYARTDMLEKRRELMEAWGRVLAKR